jgi:hypothetical protein
MEFFDPKCLDQVPGCLSDVERGMTGTLIEYLLPNADRSDTTMNLIEIWGLLLHKEITSKSR